MRKRIVMGGVVAIVALAAYNGQHKDPEPTVRQVANYTPPPYQGVMPPAPVEQAAPARITPVDTAPTPTGAPTPAIQVRFDEAVQAGTDAYKNGANDIQKGASRPKRAKAICSLMGSTRFSEWVGTIYKITTNNDGKGVLEVQIGPSVWVKTWNNALSDIGDNTLIDESSRVYAKLSDMKEGQKVTISGNFLKSDTDCFKEPSMSLSGSMREPEFIARFTDITAVN